MNSMQRFAPVLTATPDTTRIIARHREYLDCDRGVGINLKP